MDETKRSEGHADKPSAWYAVKDSDSYSSVRYRAVLHEAFGEQEVWIAHNLAHHHAQQIADDHNRVAPSAGVQTFAPAELLDKCIMALSGEYVEKPDDAGEEWNAAVGYCIGKLRVMQEQLPVVAQSANTSTSDYEEVLADHRRLCRELDAILSYPDEPARQASLCDLIPFAKSIATRARRYRFLRDTPPWKSPLVVIDSRNVGDDIRMLTLEALDAMIDAAMADVGTTKNAADRSTRDAS